LYHISPVPAFPVSLPAEPLRAYSVSGSQSANLLVNPDLCGSLNLFLSRISNIIIFHHPIFNSIQHSSIHKITNSTISSPALLFIRICKNIPVATHPVLPAHFIPLRCGTLPLHYVNAFFLPSLHAMIKKESRWCGTHFLSPQKPIHFIPFPRSLAPFHSFTG
jgi:hypothetical protein